MVLKEQITKEMKAALKNQNKERLSIIRLIISDIKYAEIETRKELDDTSIIEVLSRMKKKHEDSILAYKQGHREDLVAKEEGELKVIEEFMPRSLTEEEIDQMIQKAIEETGATGPKDMGKIMSAIKDQYAGRASGKAISEKVKERLNKL